MKEDSKEKESKKIEKAETIIPVSKDIKKTIKLTYNDQREYDNLPKQIEELEIKIAELEKCIMNPECYQDKGLIEVSRELDDTMKENEQKVERFLELEEIVENF